MLVVKCTAIFAAAWLIVFLLRRRSAALRNLVWTGAFTAVLALPVLSNALPSLHVPAPWLMQTEATTFQTTVTIPASSAARQINLASARTKPAQGLAVPAVLAYVWIFGSACSLFQMLIASISLIRLRRSLSPFPEAGFPELQRMLGISHKISLLAANPGTMPAAFGIFEPTVLLPVDALNWPGERRRVVLLHEIAHIARGDTFTQVIARTALAVYWWNPLAWVAWFSFLKEREHAADDAVLASGARNTDYASHLLDVARAVRPMSVLAGSAICMARRGRLEDRMKAILDSHISRTVTGSTAIVATLVAAIVISAPIATVRAQSADVETTIRAAEAQKNPQMLEDAAKAAVLVRNYDTATKLLESALVLRGNTFEAGLTLIRLGDLKQAQGNLNDALPYYSRAIAVLQNHPEAARAVIEMGVAQLLIQKSFANGYQSFELAQSLDPKHAGPATMWMAVVRQRQGNLEEAESLYRASLTMEPSAATSRLLAILIRKQGREAEAKDIERQVPPARLQQLHPADAYRIGGDVQAPAVLSKVEPKYTDDARAALLWGTVAVHLVIGADGRAQDMSVARSLGLGLDENAMEAIRQWQFKPGTRNGQPVPVMATIEVNYRLL
jgi:TonB family protein